jgi:hypothetical protein
MVRTIVLSLMPHMQNTKNGSIFEIIFLQYYDYFFEKTTHFDLIEFKTIFVLKERMEDRIGMSSVIDNLFLDSSKDTPENTTFLISVPNRRVFLVAEWHEECRLVPLAMGTTQVDQ